MNPQERLQLDKLIRANDVADNTKDIRDLSIVSRLKMIFLCYLK